ncbi:poly-beta-1,6-N-acetyl-D-glucosamine N-deacetylase PgaB [Dendrosporobacter sp. 1207_IL3150]|uniref:poly-beta-1,6-N-acetyl-D-glucosamine N-deacetylase PgaB n=1 Tax=Dendrosporobacter sp. 1207_IL3150 TaxID=3084054 RepID=UPI002FDB72A0
MKTNIILILTIAFLWISSPAYAGQPGLDIPILNYHDVGKTNSPFSVTKETLSDHFKIIKEQGYQPISADQYLAAKNGQASLPPKAILLTFDDGYISFYNEVFPLLKEFKYPAMLALVTSWQQNGAPADIGPIVNWGQVRELEASGLVTIASHSHNMHQFQVTNKFNDTSQAMSSSTFKNGEYESLVEYKQRINRDMELTQSILEENLGHRSKYFVWPYGEYTAYSAQAAKDNGFEVLFALNDNAADSSANSLSIKRTIIYGNPNKESFLKLLANSADTVKPVRAAQLDLDLLYCQSASEFASNMDAAVQLLRRSQVNTVFLQAFADDKGTGNIEEVYFHTTAAPVKADLFSHAASLLKKEGFQVYAWVPTLSGQWLLKDHAEDEVQAIDDKHHGWYKRATPFSSRVQQELKNLFRDLAAYSPIDGILFQDDVYLNDYEDNSPAARAAFKSAFGLELSAEHLKNHDTALKWANLKAETLNKLTLELADEVRKFHPRLKVARNIYPIVITNSDAFEWIGQRYGDYLKLYDYTVVMAYPYLEKVPEPNIWLKQLAHQALTDPKTADKVIFKLQAYDWDKRRWLSTSILNEQASLLKTNGSLHLAYYPLNIYSNKKEALPY